MSGHLTLYGLYYSPWTERARWALDHHAITHRYREHVPFLGEPLLKLLARGTGKATASVPLLRGKDLAIGDSIEIMAHADARGHNTSLQAASDEVNHWHAQIEDALGAIRKRVTRCVLNDREALREAAEAATPALLAGFFRPVAAAGARHIASKYAFQAEEKDGEYEVVRRCLDALRDALATRRHLLGEFSAADILAATMLQGIRPVDGHMTLKPATHRAWHDRALASEYDDLLRWRDDLYADFRRPTPEQ